MKYVLLPLFIFLLAGCNQKYPDYLPTEKFKTIFADAAQGVDYFPIDIIQTEEGGFLILAEGALNSVFVLKVDNRGQQQWSTTMPATFVNPVGDMVFNEGKYYFIAANSADQTAALLEIDDFNQQVNATQRSYPGYRMPLAFGKYDSDNYLMLNYNDTTGPVLSKIQAGFAMEWARRYDYNGQQKEATVDALNNKSFNFFVGNFNNGQNLFFNAIRNEGNVMTYTNGEGISTGKISATSNDKIISYNYLGNQVSAINYYKGGVVHFENAHPLSEMDSSSVNQIEGTILADFGIGANAYIVNDEIVATSNLINIYGTIDGRLKWLNYAIASDRLNNVDYIGGQDPLSIVKALTTNDGGLVVLAAVLIGSTRSRIMIQKIPREELNGLTN